MDSDILLAFRFMRMQINIDLEKYQKTCEKNRQNIMKRWSKKEKDTTVDLVIPNKNKDKDKDKDKNKDWEVVGRINSSSSSSTVSDIANGNEEEDEEENFSMMMKEKFLPWFNSILDNADSKIPRIQDFNDQRKERFVAVHKKYGIGKEGTTG